ncbi:hypothetical protein BH18ACT7_BH18ACT7_18250 [soil metagenome]
MTSTVVAPPGLTSWPQVLPSVADHPQPVSGRVEVDAEVRSLERHSQLGHLGRGGARIVQGVDAAGVADAVQQAVLHPVGDADQPAVTLQAAHPTDPGHLFRAIDPERDQPLAGGETDRYQILATTVAGRAGVGTGLSRGEWRPGYDCGQGSAAVKPRIVLRCMWCSCRVAPTARVAHPAPVCWPGKGAYGWLLPGVHPRGKRLTGSLRSAVLTELRPI